MNFPFVFRPGKVPAVILACLLFAACSTTQKGSTGSGSQEAAPISEAGKTEPGTSSSSPSGTAASSPAAAPVTSAEGSPGTRQRTAPAPGDEEAARLQQQLADQEAEINRMREEQVNSQRLADEEAVRQRAAESAASAAATAAPDRPAEASSSSSTQSPTGAATGSAAAGAASQAAEAADDSLLNGQPVTDQPLQRSIYFKYDDATIGDEYDSVLIAHAAFLKSHPDYQAEVQGNCDERGSREYNLALGARRAEAVKRGLELAGADGSRIKVVSFGAEKPVAFGQDEESYKKNRRADILY
ncbi:MAG TPA: peptidoglycan-associated lipoprotein Pal [Burkholderiales bacterium]